MNEIPDDDHLQAWLKVSTRDVADIVMALRYFAKLVENLVERGPEHQAPPASPVELRMLADALTNDQSRFIVSDHAEAVLRAFERDGNPPMSSVITLAEQVAGRRFSPD